MGLLKSISVMAGNWAQQRAYKREGNRNAEMKEDASERLDQLKTDRQSIINPYEGFTAFQFDNPFANLSVATEAAEFQAEEADAALANTLDTLRATGASGGGATALANAALRSKKQVSSSIQTQEAANQKLMAQGEQSRQSMQATEQSRVQQGEALGKKFMFNAQETRQFRDEQDAINERNYYRSLEDTYRKARTAGVGSNVSQTVYTAGKGIEAGANFYANNIAV